MPDKCQNFRNPCNQCPLGVDQIVADLMATGDAEEQLVKQLVLG